ncbi:MAG TPA: DNA-binding domain-containing protein, partial [bacterium]|nr:DNA-binding domain-containing protein [bacterium]
DPQYPDPHNGLKVYRGNLVFGLIGAMQESYGFTKVLLGEDNFNFFCREFLYQNPSQDSDLIQYGAGFGELLSTREELKSLAFISDVARLEWALERAFYAKAEPSFLGDITQSWQNALPIFKKAVQLVRTQYKIHEAWLAFTEKGEEGIGLEMFKKEPENLVVWSDEGSPRVTPVNSILAACMEGVLRDQDAAAMIQTGLTEQNMIEAYRFAIKQGWIAR